MAKPALEVIPGKSQPTIVLFRAQPFVVVTVGIGDHEPTAGLQAPGHFLDGAGWIRRVMQNHIRDDRFNFTRLEREQVHVAPACLKISTGKSLRDFREHCFGGIDANDARALVKGRFGEKARARPDVSDSIALGNPGRAHYGQADAVAEELPAHLLPLARDAIEVLLRRAIFVGLFSVALHFAATLMLSPSSANDHRPKISQAKRAMIAMTTARKIRRTNWLPLRIARRAPSRPPATLHSAIGNA